MEEKLIIAVACFPVIYDVSLFVYSGNSIHLLKTIPRLVNVSYNVEIRLALNHEHKSTPHKWLLIGLFS